MRNFKYAARSTAAAMMIVALGWMQTTNAAPAEPSASPAELPPVAVKTAAKPSSYYAYIPDHSIYFVDADAQYDWAYPAIDFLAASNVASGVGDHLFAPDQPITRADFMVMLYRAYDMSAYSAPATFADVPDGAYYADAVGAAETLGIAAGSSGSFSPREHVTREDAVVFLKRTLDLTGLRFESAAPSGFTDMDKVSPYAAEAVAALSTAGVLSGSGDGTLNPQDEITRAEMAALLYRALHLTDEGVYSDQPDLLNLCIGDTIYTDVRVQGGLPAGSYKGLVRCLTFYETADGYFIELGGAEEFDQQVSYQDGALTVDGKPFDLAQDAVCVNVSPYSTLDAPVSTGSEYRAAKVAVLDGLVTEIYYSA